MLYFYDAMFLLHCHSGPMIILAQLEYGTRNLLCVSVMWYFMLNVSYKTLNPVLINAVLV